MSKIEKVLMSVAMNTLVCDCGGEMESDGRTLETFPVQYRHICEICGESTYTTKLYPYPVVKGVL